MEKYAQPISLAKERRIEAERTRFASVGIYVDQAHLIKSLEIITMDSPSLVIVVVDSLVVAPDLLKYANNFYKKLGRYPVILCINGFSGCKWMKYTNSMNLYMKRFLIRCGIPVKNVIVPQVDEKDHIVFLRNYMEKRLLNRASVFASRNYSLSTAIALREAVPEVDLRFYESPYVSDDMARMTGLIPSSNAIFDVDDISSLGLDLLIGQIIRLNMRKAQLFSHISEDMSPRIYKKLEALFENYESIEPEDEVWLILKKKLTLSVLKKHLTVFGGLMSIEVAKKFVAKGYVLGLSTKEERQAVGLSEEEFEKVLVHRLKDFPWRHSHRKRMEGQLSSLSDYCK
jgi:hypothetical protein